MKCMDKHGFEQQNVFGTGAANTAYAKFFIGQSFLNPLTDPKTGLFLANVTFEPGCRNNWHIHHAAKGGAHLCSIQYYLRFWLGICRTSLTVSALRIMRYCPKISKNHIFAKIGKLHFGCTHTVKRLSHLPGNFHQAAY